MIYLVTCKDSKKQHVGETGTHSIQDTKVTLAKFQVCLCQVISAKHLFFLEHIFFVGLEICNRSVSFRKEREG